MYYVPRNLLTLWDVSSIPANGIFPTVVCVCFLPIHSGHQVRWTYQPGSHKISRASSFCSACHSFPSSTVKSNVVYYNDLIVLHPLGIFFFIFFF